MSTSLRLVTIFFALLYFVVLVILLKNGRLALKYSLLWIFSGVLFWIAVAFPDLLVFVTSFIGIEVPTNGLCINCFELSEIGTCISSKIF